MLKIYLKYPKKPKPIVRTERFTMPCLNRYEFDYNGDCYRKGSDVKLKPDKGRKQPMYQVIHDDLSHGRVWVAEVVKYGKHLKEMQRMKQIEKMGLATKEVFIRPRIKYIH